MNKNIGMHILTDKIIGNNHKSNFIILLGNFHKILTVFLIQNKDFIITRSRKSVHKI